jgi:hypothetical protein
MGLATLAALADDRHRRAGLSRDRPVPARHLPIIAFPPYYRGEAIDARVVDQATGKPLQGVVVVNRSTLGGVELQPFRVLVIQETTTGDDGRFHLPPWGPKLRWPPLSRIRCGDPQLWLFKSGCFPLLEGNRCTSTADRLVTHASEWNAKTLNLRPGDREPEGYAKAVADLAADSVRRAFFDHACDWQRVPRLIGALHEESLALASVGRWPGDIVLGRELPLDTWERMRARECQSVRRFLETKP